MKKIIILLLCCGVLLSMVGCGCNTAPPSTESPPTTVSETAKDIGRMSVVPSTPIWQSELCMTDITGMSAYAWTLKIKT